MEKRDKIEVKYLGNLKYKKASFFNRLLFIVTIGTFGSLEEEYSTPIGYFKDLSIDNKGSIRIILEGEE